MPRAIRIDSGDNVATLVAATAPGEAIEVTGAGEAFALPAAEAIPAGHKVALVALAAGQPVRKYGEVIGRTTADVPAGARVHSHNLEGMRGRQ